MKRILGIIVLVSTSAYSCSATHWPASAQRLVSRLDCGMNPERVEHLSSQKLDRETRLDEFGSHVLRLDTTNLWLDFDGGRLKSVMLARPDPWKLKGMKVSPKRDLCTGELSFFLRLSVATELEGATVYIDGQKVEDYPWGFPFEIPGGKHELRVEKEGYATVIKRLQLGEDDPGELWLTITGEDVRRLNLTTQGSNPNPRH